MPNPTRLHRTRRRNAFTPAGAVYVGRPTLWGNPFTRPGIGHARSIILYRAWISGEITPHVLRCAGFDDAEIDSLHRWHARLLPQLPYLRGKDLQCWCPLTSVWCHAAKLLDVVNAPRDRRRAA